MRSGFLSLIFPIPILVLIITCLITMVVAGEEPDNQTGNSIIPGDIGPDYVITGISLPKTSSWIEPGMVINPNITIWNAGENDTTAGTILISASLGDYPLISRNSTIIPMKKDEKRAVTMEYLIPDGIPSREYPLVLSLDSEHEQKGVDTKNNEAITSNTLTLQTASRGVKVNGCGCS